MKPRHRFHPRPQLGALLNYDGGSNFVYRFGVSLVWLLPFMFLAGAIQLPMQDEELMKRTTRFVHNCTKPHFMVNLVCIS